jgi:hypothetical protein
VHVSKASVAALFYRCATFYSKLKFSVVVFHSLGLIGRQAEPSGYCLSFWLELFAFQATLTIFNRDQRPKINLKIIEAHLAQRRKRICL